MRQMSFSLTTPQMRARTKTVTRRLGWGNLKPGEILVAIEKGQGLKKGEHPVKICEIRVESNIPERLGQIIYDRYETTREGFPELNWEQFVAFFCKANKCQASQKVNRIQFEFV